MPLFKNGITGQEITADDDYISAFPADTWERLADESPEETERRKLREQEEAIRNKVEVEEGEPEAARVEGEPAPVQENPEGQPAPVQENPEGEPAPPPVELGVVHHDQNDQEG